MQCKLALQWGRREVLKGLLADDYNQVLAAAKRDKNCVVVVKADRSR